MLTLTPHRLCFPGGVRLGLPGARQEAGQTIPSDTLFSALLDAWQRRASADEFAEPFRQQTPDPPFLLTSAFPFAGEVMFFPVPSDLSSLLRPETLRARGKELKRLHFFSLGLLRKALEGKKLDDDLFPAGGEALQGGSFWLTQAETRQLPETMRRKTLPVMELVKPDRRPRVAISRTTSASALYETERVVFAEGCGLWFGIQWLQADRPVSGSAAGGCSYRKAFDQALDLLQSDGLGGGRSYGVGGFSAEAGAALQLPASTPGGLSYLLSRYHPRPEELPQVLDGRPGTTYQTVTLGGWMHSYSGPAQRRKRLLLLAEGGLVCAPPFPAGDVVDIGPDYPSGAGAPAHPVLRSGLACLVGWPDVNGGK